MTKSLNLRGDLAKLGDTELAERLEATWRDLDAVRKRRRPWWRGGGPLFPWRGPIRHPRAYRFLSLLALGEGNVFAAALGAAWSGKAVERALRGDVETDEFLSVCEVRDIMDEIARRVAARKAGSQAGRPGGAPRGA